MAVNELKTPQLTTESTDPPSRRSGVSLRAVIVGLILVAVVCLVVTWGEIVITRIQVGFLQMPPAAIGIFFFLVLLNIQLQKVSKRLGLNPGEMLMIYCMMIVAAMVSSRGVMEKLISVVVTPNYYANSGNNWKELYFPHIKRWMVPFDPAGGPQQRVAKQLFEGLRDGEHIPWGQWLVPMAAWTVLILLVVFAFLCIATILRRQWVDNEKLSFPLVQPPLELVQQQGESIFSNRLFWGGVALPVVVFAINGIHTMLPNVPEIQLQLYLNTFFTTAPWNNIYWTCLFFSFAAIGFFFLLPSDLLFSIWFFAIFARLQGVVAASYGMDLPRMRVYGTYKMVAYQTMGAYFVIVGYLILVSWPHLKTVWRSVTGQQKVDDSGEMMPYRLAFWGLIFAFLGILGWAVLAGMSPALAILEFGVFLFIVALIMTRSTAEGGMLMTETTFRPVDIYSMFAPAQHLAPANITMLAFFDSMFLREQRGLLFTGIFDGLKISDGANMKRRSFLFVFVLALLFSMVFAMVLQIWLPYTKGGINLYETVYQGHNLGLFKDYEALSREPVNQDWQAPTFFVVGILFTILLAYMRTMFFWWPLHPLGYALCVSWTVSVFWFSAFIAWLIKVLILRYGGMKLYSKARPWFIGMVIGEFGSAVLWTLIGFLTGRPTTPLFPWP